MFATAEKLRARIRGAGARHACGRGRPAPSMPTWPPAASRSWPIELELLNRSDPLPFQLDEEVSEEVRLRYRYIDLRREIMNQRLRLRHRITRSMRGYLDAPGLRRHRNADADQGHARGRARLPGAEPHPCRQVLRAAAVAADLQAAADDRGLRALLPDRALLSRRGSARRSPAGIHAARRRDLVPDAGADHAADGRAVR